MEGGSCNSTALRDDPDYVKALQRRAASNEVLDTWASLASAQEGSSASLDTSHELKS